MGIFERFKKSASAAVNTVADNQNERLARWRQKQGMSAEDAEEISKHTGNLDAPVIISSPINGEPTAAGSAVRNALRRLFHRTS